MKIPVRSAPLPPSSNQNMSLHHNTCAFDDWCDCNDPLCKHIFSNGPLSVHVGRPPGEKKKPPPRPPPPKFPQKYQQKQVPTRPRLLSGLFTRNASSHSTHSQHSISAQQKNMKKESQTTVGATPLIDFRSPSCSPTPTTHSSSDGLSVNSFGSDGSVSNNGHTPFGGSSSLFESGFEDDFDFFGGLTRSSSFGTPLDKQKDPWSVSKSEELFLPSKQQNFSVNSASVQKVAGNSTFYKQSSDSSSSAVRHSCISSMPTIIRAKPGRPPALPKLNKASSDQTSDISWFPLETKSQAFPHLVPIRDFDDVGNWSPPMPSIPPPPPPPEALQELESDGPSPQLPPRPVHLQVEDVQNPYGIALYDYPATHPDDLAFQANDTIFLLRQVNTEWLYGQVGLNQGMFPATFIKVIVPLHDTKGSTTQRSQRPAAQIVTALYPFAAETWDDLELREGSSVYVISRINNDWLYGESGGKYGQFPASFASHIPANLPLRTN
ncbi:zinc finger protein 865 isoform X2 [Zootermopsis nevadensis]|nr:zinc finger protein 865 isoform X2 [Zootermopsis nevadensis]XP_021925348.1 zinc finger protein 865 isoform X2 [Zootermopsis nevadensis]